MTIRPDRYRNAIVPHIYVDGASDGIAFYKRAFGAVELFRMARPNGKLLHAEISIEGSVVGAAPPASTFLRTTTRLSFGGRSSLGPKKSNHQPRCSMARVPLACAIPSAMSGCCFRGRKISIRPRWNVVERNSWASECGHLGTEKRRNKECDSCC